MALLLDALLVHRVQQMNPSCLRLNLSRNGIYGPEAGDDGVLLPLSTLLALNLSYNSLRSLGPAFSVLTRLQVLDVSHNHVEHLHGLSVCTALQHLDVSHNRIGHWEEVIALETCTGMETFSIAGNPVVFTLPPDQSLALVRGIFPALQLMDGTLLRPSIKPSAAAPTVEDGGESGGRGEGGEGEGVEREEESEGVNDGSGDSALPSSSSSSSSSLSASQPPPPSSRRPSFEQATQGHTIEASSSSSISSSQENERPSLTVAPHSQQVMSKGKGKGAVAVVSAFESSSDAGNGISTPSISPSLNNSTASPSNSTTSTPRRAAEGKIQPPTPHRQGKEEGEEPKAPPPPPLPSSSGLTPTRPPSLDNISSRSVGGSALSSAGGGGGGELSSSIVSSKSGKLSAPPHLPRAPLGVGINAGAPTPTPLPPSTTTTTTTTTTSSLPRGPYQPVSLPPIPSPAFQASSTLPSQLSSSSSSSSSASSASGAYVLAAETEMLRTQLAQSTAQLQAARGVLVEYEGILSSAFAEVQRQQQAGSVSGSGGSGGDDFAAQASAYKRSLEALRERVEGAEGGAAAAVAAGRVERKRANDAEARLAKVIEESARAVSASGSEAATALARCQGLREECEVARGELARGREEAGRRLEASEWGRRRAEEVALAAKAELEGVKAAMEAGEREARGWFHKELEAMEGKVREAVEGGRRARKEAGEARQTVEELQGKAEEWESRCMAAEARITKSTTAATHARCAADSAGRSVGVLLRLIGGKAGGVGSASASSASATTGAIRLDTGSDTPSPPVNNNHHNVITTGGGGVVGALETLVSGCNQLHAFVEASMTTLSGRLSAAGERVAALRAGLDSRVHLRQEGVDALKAEREAWAEAVRESRARTQAKWEVMSAVQAKEAEVERLKGGGGEGEEEEEEEGLPRLAYETAKGECAALKGRLQAMVKVQEEGVVLAANALKAACARTDAALVGEGGGGEQNHHHQQQQQTLVDFPGGENEEIVEEEEEEGKETGKVEASPTPTSFSSLLDAPTARAHLYRALGDASRLRASIAHLLASHRAQTLASATKYAALQHANEHSLAAALERAQGAEARAASALSTLAREREEASAAAARASGARSSALTTARESALRHKAEAANLGVALEGARGELEAARREVVRLEAEVEAGRARHEEAHKAALTAFAAQLSSALASGEVARREGEAAKKEAELAKGALDTVQRLQEEVVAARRDKATFLATASSTTLFQPPTTPFAVHLTPGAVAAAGAVAAGATHPPPRPLP